MTKAAIIVELDLPASFLILRLRRPVDALIADNLNVIGFRTDKVHKKGPNDWRHAGRKNNDWNAICSGPLVEVTEVRIKLDVFAKKLDAFREGVLDAIHHLSKGVSL